MSEPKPTPPMFLPAVESHAEPSPYLDAVRAMQAAGAEYPKIWHLFAFRPQATQHLARFTQEVMREPGPISPGLRELIAAYTSARNQCPFWLKSHAAVAAVLLASELWLDAAAAEALVDSAVRDLEASALPEKEKALLRFVDRVNHGSPSITAADMQPLYAAGWADDAIYYAITVCALFNFYNRWVDATGVAALSDEAHRQGGRRSAAMGYVRK